MKGNMEKRALKAVEAVVKAGMKKKGSPSSICPVFFHQPKRPTK